MPSRQKLGKILESSGWKNVNKIKPLSSILILSLMIDCMERNVVQFQYYSILKLFRLKLWFYYKFEFHNLSTTDMILIMINIDKHQRSKLAKLFECMYYNGTLQWKPNGNGNSSFCKGPRTSKVWKSWDSAFLMDALMLIK